MPLPILAYYWCNIEYYTDSSLATDLQARERPAELPYDPSDGREPLFGNYVSP